MGGIIHCLSIVLYVNIRGTVKESLTGTEYLSGRMESTLFISLRAPMLEKCEAMSEVFKDLGAWIQTDL